MFVLWEKRQFVISFYMVWGILCELISKFQSFYVVWTNASKNYCKDVAKNAQPKIIHWCYNSIFSMQFWSRLLSAGLAAPSKKCREWTDLIVQAKRVRENETESIKSLAFVSQINTKIMTCVKYKVNVMAWGRMMSKA